MLSSRRYRSQQRLNSAGEVARVAQRKNSQVGFTLIELMIVLVVLGIIAAIAYPSYQRYVERANRVDAQAAMMDAAQSMERCFTLRNTYVDCDADNNIAGRLNLEANNRYTITIDQVAPAAFRVNAAPGRPFDCPADGDALRLDHLGQRIPEGCW